VLEEIIELKREYAVGGWRKSHSEDRHALNCALDIGGGQNVGTQRAISRGAASSFRGRKLEVRVQTRDLVVRGRSVLACIVMGLCGLERDKWVVELL
jgi:hypothetical protein